MTQDKPVLIMSQATLASLLVEVSARPTKPTEAPAWLLENFPFLSDDAPSFSETLIPMSPQVWEMLKIRADLENPVRFSPPLPRTDRAARRSKR